MRAWLRDLRYSGRGLRRTPGFTALVLLTIGLGTGANATVFGFLDALLFRPVPGVADPSRLVSIYTTDFSNGPFGPSSHADLQSLRAGATSLAVIAAAQDDPVATLTTDVAVERVRVASVTRAYLDVLGSTATLGRLLTTADAATGAAAVAVISDALWERQFLRDHGVLTHTLTVNRQPYQIIGVGPRGFGGFELSRPVDVWLPILTPSAADAQRGNRSLAVVARLRDGLRVRDATADVARISAALAVEFPETNRGIAGDPAAPRAMTAIALTRLDPTYRAQVTLIAWVIASATGLVLLICCANVATLLLSRAASRAREVAVRLALGASRAALIRALVADGLLIGAGGTAVGLLFARWTMDALPSFFPVEWARMLDAHIDVRGWILTLAIAMTCAVVASLAPIGLARRAEAIAALRGDGGAGADARSHRVRELLVVLQVALACVLLVSTGLLSQSLTSAFRTDAGMAARGVLTSSAQLWAGLPPHMGRKYFRETLERVRGLSGVEVAAWTSSLPLQDANRRSYSVEGYVPAPGENMDVPITTVTPGYFDAMHVTLVEGRLFTEADRWNTAPVVVINDAMARKYFRGHAIGRHLTDPRGPVAEVIGVVQTEKYRTLQDAPAPVVFYPLEQNHLDYMIMLARVASPSDAMLSAVYAMLDDPLLPVPARQSPPQPLEATLTARLAPERLTTALVSACGVLAVALAMVGLYGVTAYAVLRRTREIGVRVALGARPISVARLVLSAGMRLTLAGCAIGLVCGAAATPILGSVVHGATGPAIASFAVVPVLLATTAALASVIPIFRALRVQPNVALRAE